MVGSDVMKIFSLLSGVSDFYCQEDLLEEGALVVALFDV